MVFQTTFDGVWRAYRNRLSPAVLAELRGLGLAFDRLHPAYPLSLWESTARCMAAALFPGVAETEAWRSFGRGFVDGYVQTLVGSAVIGLGRAIGTRRFLERMSRNFKTGSNFAPVSVTTVGSNEVIIESRFDPLFLPAWRGRPTVMPHFRFGVLESFMAQMGGTFEVVMERADLEEQVAQYRIRWN